MKVTLLDIYSHYATTTHSTNSMWDIGSDLVSILFWWIPSSILNIIIWNRTQHLFRFMLIIFQGNFYYLSMIYLIRIKQLANFILCIVMIKKFIFTPKLQITKDYFTVGYFILLNCFIN